MTAARRLVVAVIAACVAALWALGCGDGRRPLPAACTDGPGPVVVALRRAPGPVALRDGTRLSACVERARDPGELEQVGAELTAVADGLARRAAASDARALQLGFLVGAARLGARRSNGVAAELVPRLERDLEGVPAARRTALRRGLALGERVG